MTSRLHRTVPADWREMAMGDAFAVIRNGLPVRQGSGGGLPITRIETISDGRVDANRVGFAGLDANACAEWLLAPGDILLSHINSPAHIGKCALYTGTPGALVHGMNLLCLRPDPAVLDARWALYCLRQPEFRGQLGRFVNRAVNQASVSIHNLRSIDLSVPPLEEQRRIADVLDRADALRARRREALARLDELTQSIFVDMFGEPATLGRGQGTPLADMAEIVRGVTFKPDQVSSLPDEIGTIRCLTTRHVQARLVLADPTIVPRSVVTSDRQLLRVGDVLMSTANSANLVGKTCLVDRLEGETTLGGFIAALRPGSKPDGSFLAAALSGVAMRTKLAGLARQTTNIANIDLSRLRQLPLPKTSADERELFSRRAASVEAAIVAATTDLARLDELFASLQQRAFRGDLFSSPLPDELADAVA